MSKLNEKELQKLRDRLHNENVDLGYASQEDKYTCDDCPVKHDCDFVFDAYNLNGDCLAEK